MKSIKSIILILISTLIFLLFWLDAYASSYISESENQVLSWSVDETNTVLVKSSDSATSNSGTNSELEEKKSDVDNKTLDKKIENWIINQDTEWAWLSEEQKLKVLNEYSSENNEDETDKQTETIETVKDVKYFYVTAYYSPVQWQRTYITWSYTWDVRLNWAWRNTASWKKVFDWLLAAPSSYTFWTKIELEWIWVWEVADRWWAIVNSWTQWNTYDRIDVWMWYWDEWLYRALKWGKRKILWNIVSSTRQLSMDFAWSSILKYRDLRVDAENPVGKDVIRLQNLLKEVKIYSWEIDGKFESVKDVLIKYQVENNIISSKDDNQAGYFWTKTLAVLREEFWSDVFKSKNNKLDKDFVLSTEIKDKLNLLNNKVSLLIDSKFWKNTPKSIAYRWKLRNLIEKQTKKSRNELKRNQLKYLKSVL